jgi:hypothetical protein
MTILQIIRVQVDSLASNRGTARRAYVGEPVARGVLACPLCHGCNVEAVEPEAGRGVPPHSTRPVEVPL